MSKKIYGEVYYLVDVIYDDDFIYEVYESESGKRVKVPLEVRY